MPSTSGRAATYPKRADKLRFFSELKELRDTLRAKRQLGMDSSKEQQSDHSHSSPAQAE